MTFAQFFITRPRFAIVLSLLIWIAGAMSYDSLPVAQYPKIAPPTVTVHAVYPGASPEVMVETVAVPLEEQINGVEGMLYLSTQAIEGSVAITVTFAIGTDPDQAQIQVQNRVQRAVPRLPATVQALGVNVAKRSPSIMMVVQLTSPDGELDIDFLSNYASIAVSEPLKRVDGVGDTSLLGARDYSMRLWLDPEKMASLQLIPADVLAAVREQNIQVAAGGFGRPPLADDARHAFEYSLSAKGRLDTVEEFGGIVVKRGEGGRVVRLRDVARVELGAASYSTATFLNQEPSVALAVFQRPGSNAIKVAESVREKMTELAAGFPDGVRYSVDFDPTVFVKSSIAEVEQTILEASALVILVIIIFLQSWRAALIPLVAIPVSLVGTYAIMSLCDFSLNSLSLFGLVLAIGIVVDDAIVVVENIQRKVEDGLAPLAAARAAMNEVSGAVIAATTVMAAIFIPVAMMGGITGEFYRQFGLTIAGSVAISGFVSLTLSPALCAVLLQPKDAEPGFLTRLWNRLLGGLFALFNKGFGVLARMYNTTLSQALRAPLLVMVLYAVLLGMTAWGFWLTPTGFIPKQDQGYALLAVDLPAGASLDRTLAVTRTVAERVKDTPGVEALITFAGLNPATFSSQSNAAACFVPFKSFAERDAKGLTADRIVADLTRRLAGVEQARIFTIPPPPVQGLGTAGGFKMQVLDTTGQLEPAEFAEVVQRLSRAAMAEPAVSVAYTTFQADTPRVVADIDRVKAEKLGVPLINIFDALQTFLGSSYVNDFNLFGRTYHVTAQADSRFRAEPEDLFKLQTRNDQGQMVPLASLVTLQQSTGPVRLPRYNLYSTVPVMGQAARGFSSGEALDAMEQAARQTLPPGVTFAWTDIAFQERAAGNTALLIFALAILFVFLTLVAQFESWSLPLAVILIVPLCLTGAIWLVIARGMDNNILTQVGFVVLVGMAAKNAILIVEFARQKVDEGLELLDAATEAARLRLRPILMTALAFILGVVPLMLATGPGAEMRHAIGTAVFGGMVLITVLTLIITPVLFVVIEQLMGKKEAN